VPGFFDDQSGRGPDTDLGDGLVFTLQGSHIVTFDNNLNRRFAQTVLSTVLQFQFFGGK